MTARRAPVSLRIALLAWPREARAESGRALIDLAQELVDAGSSPARQARSLAASGVAARGRRRIGYLRSAPWQQGRALAIALCALLLLVLVVVDGGGWRAVLTPHLTVLPDGMAPPAQQLALQVAPFILVAVLPATAIAAMLGWMRLVLAATVVLSATALVYRAGGANLSYVWVDLGPVHVDGVAGPLPVSSAIDVAGVAGLLLAAMVLCALPSAVRGWGSAPLAPGRWRLVGPVAWAAAAAVGPAAARGLERWVTGGLPAPTYGDPLPTPLFAIWLAIVLSLAAAVLLPRWAPAAATGAALLALALAIPAVWTLSGVLLLEIGAPSLLPFGITSPTLYWALVALAALLFTGWVASRAGRSAARGVRPGGGASPDGPAVVAS